MCYLYLAGLKKGKLVEKFQDQVAEHIIEFDEEDWAKITFSAIRFVQEMLAIAHVALAEIDTNTDSD